MCALCVATIGPLVTKSRPCLAFTVFTLLVLIPGWNRNCLARVADTEFNKGGLHVTIFQSNERDVTQNSGQAYYAMRTTKVDMGSHCVKPDHIIDLCDTDSCIPGDPFVAINDQDFPLEASNCLHFVVIDLV